MDDIFIFIQARSTSTRLPRKVLKIFTESPELTILDHIFLRLEGVINQDKIIFLIPYGDMDLVDFCKKRKYNFFEGDENNVRDRFLKAGNFYKAKKIIRLTGDNPFIDILHLELIIESLLFSDTDLVSFTGLPIGMGVEAFSFNALEWEPEDGLKPHHCEHVSLHIKEYPNKFRINRLKTLLSEDELKIAEKIRVTVDEEKDFLVCKKIYNSLSNNFFFSAKDIIHLYKEKSYIFEENSNINQISFKLPGPVFVNKGKVFILYANIKIHGSGHFERCKLLFIYLQLNGYKVEMSDEFPINTDFDLYIFDSRDIDIPEYLKNKKILLIDNFCETNNKNLNFYSLPNPKLDIKEVWNNILFSQLINAFKNLNLTNQNQILIYSGNLDKKSCDILDKFCFSYFINYKIIRIGGEKPVLNIQWYKKLTRKVFYDYLISSEGIVSYFGQSILEAVFLGKNIYLYSISDYHEELSKHFYNYFPCTNFQHLTNLAEIKPKQIERTNLKNEGFKNLIFKIENLLHLN